MSVVLYPFVFDLILGGGCVLVCLSTLAAKNYTRQAYEPHVRRRRASSGVDSRLHLRGTVRARAPRKALAEPLHNHCNQEQAAQSNVYDAPHRCGRDRRRRKGAARRGGPRGRGAGATRSNRHDAGPPRRRGAGAASIQKEDEDYSACTTVAAELAFARLEIAALQHDNAVLASENRVLANARNLPEVVADVREGTSASSTATTPALQAGGLKILCR